MTKKIRVKNKTQVHKSRLNALTTFFINCRGKWLFIINSARVSKFFVIPHHAFKMDEPNIFKKVTF